MAKKSGLVALFSGSVFIIFCAIFRTILMIMNPIDGALTAGSWSVRETFVATITSNLPAVFPLFRSWFKPIISALSSSASLIKKPSRALSSDVYTFGRSPRNNRRRGVAPTPNPITDITFNESEECMVDGIAIPSVQRSRENTINQPAGIADNGVWKDAETLVSIETVPGQDVIAGQGERGNGSSKYGL